LTAFDRFLGEGEIRKVAFEEFYAGNVVEIAALSRYQGIGDPHPMASPDQFFCQVRTNESGAAGHEVMSHALTLAISVLLPDYFGKPAVGIPGTSRNAF